MSLMPNESLRLRSDYPGDNQASEIKSLRQQLEMAEACLAGDNALIVGLKNDIAEKDAEIERLKGECLSLAIESTPGIQLAASQAREVRLWEALNHHHEIGLGRGRDKSHSLSQLIISGYKHGPLCRITSEALALPQDTTALEAMIAKAGEVMRRGALREHASSTEGEWQYLERRIRALPPITLKDLE